MIADVSAEPDLGPWAVATGRIRSRAARRPLRFPGREVVAQPLGSSSFRAAVTRRPFRSESFHSRRARFVRLRRSHEIGENCRCRFRITALVCANLSPTRSCDIPRRKNESVVPRLAGGLSRLGDRESRSRTQKVPADFVRSSCQPGTPVAPDDPPAAPTHGTGPIRSAWRPTTRENGAITSATCALVASRKEPITKAATGALLAL